MDTWAYHTGKLDADGNYKALEVDNDFEKDKYWQKYMGDSSPYRVKFSPPTTMKPPDRPQSGNATVRRCKKKKRPRWMTNEEYERLTIKSYVKKQTENENEKEVEFKNKYFENDGEILRWPEILQQQRPHSPTFKHATRATSPKPVDHEEESSIQELEAAGRQRLQGTYRPCSAPLGKSVAKNLFQKQGPATFFNDMLVATPEFPLMRKRAPSANGANRASRDSSTGSRHGNVNDSNDNRQRTLTRTSPKAKRSAGGGNTEFTHVQENDEEEDGIIEYGDTYVIENEDEAIDRIQAAMMSAVVKSASPPERKRHHNNGSLLDREREREQQYKKIGDDLFVSGKKLK